jgi:uncharacterized protein involved in exopolysaccharide biosynthesis
MSTIDRRLVALAALCAWAGCDRLPARLRPAPAARGTLVFNLDALAAVDGPAARYPLDDAFFATQLEVLRSRAVCVDALRRLGPEPTDREVQALVRAVAAQRHGGANVIEVAVRDPDPRRAAQLCNGVLEAFIRRRVEQRLEVARRLQMQLADEHEALQARRPDAPELAALAARVRDADRRAATRVSDVTVLDACLPPRPARVVH